MDRARLDPMPRRFLVGCLLGAVFGFAIVAFILASSGWAPGARHFSDDFYDAQAHAWLGGHWDVPLDVVGIEGFDTPNGVQMYFGVTPVLLRLPLLAVFGGLDGKIAPFSQLLALGVLLFATSRLTWAAASRLQIAAAGAPSDRGGAPEVEPGADRSASPSTRAGWFGPVVAAMLVALVGGCSSATFLGAQATVFAEATLWGAALAVASADVLVRHLLAPRMARAVTAAVLAGLAFNARLTSGVGALLPVALVGVVALVADRGRRGRTLTSLVPPAARSRRVGAVVLAVVIGSVAINFGANWARFGHPWKIPYERQVMFRYDKERLERYQQAPAVFSPANFATDLSAYVRPDGVRVQPYPIVSFLDLRDTIIVNAEPNFVEPTASVTAAMPGLLVLAIVGAIALVRRRGRWSSRLVAFRVPVLGAAVPAALLLVYTSLAHRYTGDFLPVLVTLSAIGAARLGLATSPRARVAGVVGLAALVLWGAWVTVGLTMWVNENNTLRTRKAVEAWAGGLATLEARLLRDPVVPQPSTPPADPGGWDLIARPDCARVYVAQLNTWYAFERAPGTGAVHLRVTPPPADGTTHALVQTADGTHRVGLRTEGTTTSLGYSEDGGQTWTPAVSGRRFREDGTRPPVPLPVDADGRIDLLVDFDWYLGTVTASGTDADSSRLLQAPLTGVPEQPVSVSPDYPGGPSALEPVREPSPRCASLTRPAG